MSDETALERLTTSSPVIVRRRVQWGECDPAGVVYTPRFGDYAAAAFFWFSRVVMNGEERRLERHNLGTPVKAMSFVFHHVLRLGDFFDMEVKLGDIRNRSFDLAVEATGATPTET